MPDIPGLNTSYGGIPRLGQGVPGGAPSLQGLPGGQQGSLIPGLPTLSAVPHIRVPSAAPVQIPSPSVIGPSTTALDTGALDHTKDRLNKAIQILQRVKYGQMEPAAAAKLLDELSPTEKRYLTQTVLQQHAREGTGASAQPELMALRYLPMGKDMGATALHDPNRGKGIGANFASDAMNTVIGMPAGLALAGKAVGADIKDIVTHPLSPTPFQGGTSRSGELQRNIITPVVKNYEKVYGSALHGDFGPMEQHPLGPILDAAALLSAGLGTAARTSDALQAIRAGRIAETAGAPVTRQVTKLGEVPLREGQGIKITEVTDKNRRDILKQIENTDWSQSGPAAEQMAQQAILSKGTRVFAAHDKNGNFLGISNHEHDFEPGPVSTLHQLASTGQVKGTGEALMKNVAEDVQKAGNSHVRLESLPAAEGFYKRMGLQQELTNPTNLPEGKLHVGNLQPGDHFITYSNGKVKGPTEYVYNGTRPDGMASVTSVKGAMHDFYENSKFRDSMGGNTFMHPAAAVEPVGDAATRTAAGVPTRDFSGEVSTGKVSEPGRKRTTVGDQYVIHQHTGRKEAVDELGIPVKYWDPKKIENQNYNLGDDHVAVSAAVDKQTGKIYSSLRDHTEINDELAQVHGVDAAWDPKRFDQYTAIVDRNGKVLSVNGKGPYMGYDPNAPEIVNDPEGQRIAQQIESKMREGAALRGKPSSLPDRFSVRDKQGRVVAQNFGDQESAIKHAQSLISPFAGKPLQAFVKGGGRRGQLLSRYEEARGFNHEAEVQNLMKEVGGVLDNQNLRFNRRSVKQVAQEVWGDLKKTRIEGRNRPEQISAGNVGFLGARPLAKGLSTGETALREASDLVRAGAIYLRPAYLPNNWVGNIFMNTVHQGVLAPVNLAKSLVVDKYIGKHYTAAMDKVMGQNAAEVVTAPKGRGYIGSVTNPIAHSMGMVADQPFRRAAFLHEARRAGYSKLTDVQKLFDRAAKDGPQREQALREVAQIGRRAQEEIVKFGHMNDTERSIVRNLIFVYSWVRGASRYAARFPLEHPIQALANYHLSNDVGNPYLDKELGGVPFYLAGSIPVGHDSKGNPILINPFSLNPLGTAVDVGRAVSGTAKVIRHPKQFNKYADTDIAAITNPLIQSYLNAREGGKTMEDQLKQTIAPLRLAHDLQHPGSGSVFPTSRTEALGHYTVGAMFPRVADQQAVTRSLEREQRNDPVARIPTDMQAYKKATGRDIPPDLVQFYQKDLVDVQKLKDFQNGYAQHHGQSGFRNLPPQNKVEAAISFLAKNGYATPAEIHSYEQTAQQLTTDAELNSFATQLFGSTGIGQYKHVWDGLLNDIRGQRLTRKRG